MGLLDGKVAIVTGGGRGLGRVHARWLAAHGAAVVVNDAGSGLHGEQLADRPADLVAAEIIEGGGRAVADHGSVTDWPATSSSCPTRSGSSAVSTSWSTTPASSGTG